MSLCDVEAQEARYASKVGVIPCDDTLAMMRACY